MDTARGQKKYVAGLSRFDIEQVLDGVIGYSFNIFFFGDLTVEPRIKFRSLVGLHDIPHFGFTESAFTFCSQLIVGVYLNGKVVVGINKFDEQRESVTICTVYMLTNQFALILSNQ